MFRAGLAVAAALAGAPLAAQAAGPADTPEYPTRFENSGKPMQDFLRNGYAVRTVTLGLDTIAMVLEKDGTWVLCSLRNSDTPAPDRMQSQCFLVQ